MSKKIFSFVKMYTVIVIGLALYAFGVTAFLIPVKITAGGVTGISMLIF